MIPSAGIYFSKAIFVPSISAYTKVTSATSTIPSYTPGKDLSWQFNLQRIWERIIHGKGSVNSCYFNLLVVFIQTGLVCSSCSKNICLSSVYQLHLKFENKTCMFGSDQLFQFDTMHCFLVKDPPEMKHHVSSCNADVLDQNHKINASAGLPPREFLYEETSLCSPEDRYFTSSAVFPSLPLTINWLRDCVRENPSLRLQVLVTGSLHLVGDVLKLLRRVSHATQPKILSLELEFCVIVIVIVFVSIFINLLRQRFILKFEVDGINEFAQSDLSNLFFHEAAIFLAIH
ncbi:hypothetical protein H5410_020742, partial [Solanum commersonii]